MTAFQATEKNQRIALADVLRGFALFFILIANVPVPETLDAVYETRNFVLGTPALDRILNMLFHLLIDKKFITIFSLLFGFGFYMQLKKAESNNINFKSYYFRRMLVLLIIGCIHAYLIWFGDIIRDYAICGMFMLLVYQWKAKKIFAMSMIFAIFLTGTVFIINGLLGLQEYSYDTAIVQELPITESYWRYLQINLTIDPFKNFIQDSPLTLVFSFGVMLIGYWLTMKGFFFNPEQFTKARKLLIVVGATIGIGCSYVFWLITKGEIELSPALLWLPYLIVAGMLLQSLFYISLFIQLFHSRHFRKVLLVFEPVGKMALTNYLFQSIVYILVFFHWTNGIKLYGRISLTETWLVAILTFVIQVVVSKWWLKHHRQGPVEQIWKLISYTFKSKKLY